MKDPIGFKVGKIVFIDEKKTKIKYSGVEKKDARPYILYKKNYFTNSIYIIPITDQFNSDGVKKNNKTWVPINIQKPSFIKVDSIMRLPLLSSNKLVWNGIIKVKESLPRQTIKDIQNKLRGK